MGTCKDCRQMYEANTDAQPKAAIENGTYATVAIYANVTRMRCYSEACLPFCKIVKVFSFKLQIM
jgi:hypothetical protein